MRKLAVLHDATLATILESSLREEGIAATITEDFTSSALFAGVRQFVIWIPDDADLDLAVELLRRTQETTTHGLCPRCGYDLSGHHGETACPECGRKVRAEPTSAPCPGCGEDVPDTFAICWSCGVEIV